MPEIADRLWAKVVKDPADDGCWNWTGARLARPRTGEPGYGVMKIGGRAGKVEYVHRISYEINVAPIPAGLCVLHHCDNTACVRPSHLFLGTKDDNNKDMAFKGRWRNQYKDNPPTHCKRGHPFDAFNTRKGSHGERVCRACARDWMRAARAQSKEERA